MVGAGKKIRRIRMGWEGVRGGAQTNRPNGSWKLRKTRKGIRDLGSMNFNARTSTTKAKKKDVGKKLRPHRRTDGGF